MKHTKIIYALGGLLLILVVAGAYYFATRKGKPATAGITNPSSVPAVAGSTEKPEGVAGVDPVEVTDKVTNFLGSLTPGGTAEAAGQERTYIISYRVAFFHKTPKGKVPEESLAYKDLRGGDPSTIPPCVYYGELVSGKYDPAQPEVIAVRATINRKQVSGYLDAANLWLEPILDRPASDRYMALPETAMVRTLPDPSSPPADLPENV